MRKRGVSAIFWIVIVQGVLFVWGFRALSLGFWIWVLLRVEGFSFVSGVLLREFCLETRFQGFYLGFRI